MKSFRIVLATRNLKKRAELEQFLSAFAIDWHTLDGYPQAPEIIEDGSDFAANAIKKASVTAMALNEWVLGEDSGLCVDALDGRPGVFSARFAGEPCNDDANNRLLIEQLAGTPAGDRGAHYVCTIALAEPTGQIHALVEGKCLGQISFEPRGSGGFGYDPYFLFGDSDQTFAELPPEFKQANSHRAEAVGRLRPILRKLVDSLVEGADSPGGLQN